MTITANIPKKLKRLDRWVCVTSDSKRPFSPLDGKPASSTDPTTWGSYKRAERLLKQGVCDYLGYVFSEGDGIIGIDIDDCFDDLGFITDEAHAAIESCASYFEISRSGHGVHILCEGDIPFSGSNNRKGWEIYKTARYFILTGNTLQDDPLRPAQAGIDKVLADHFSSDLETSERTERRPNIWQPIWPDADDLVPITADYPKITPGSRHISLVSFCGQYHTAGASPSMIREMARRVSVACMEPPLDDEEIEQVIKSVTKYRR